MSNSESLKIDSYVLKLPKTKKKRIFSALKNGLFLEDFWLANTDISSSSCVYFPFSSNLNLHSHYKSFWPLILFPEEKVLTATPNQPDNTVPEGRKASSLCRYLYSTRFRKPFMHEVLTRFIWKAPFPPASPSEHWLTPPALYQKLLRTQRQKSPWRLLESFWKFQPAPDFPSDPQETHKGA